jgi:hypothetical protein
MMSDSPIALLISPSQSPRSNRAVVPDHDQFFVDQRRQMLEELFTHLIVTVAI